MALARTTLSAAVAQGDSVITVASATSIVAGRLILIDNEWMQVQQSYASGTSVPVLRGRNGSVQTSHPTSAGVVHGDAADFANPAAQAYGSVNGPLGRVRDLRSYSAAGAIDLPTPGTDRVAILNGTGALAMTLANPTKDNDGDILIIVGNGKAAHTVTYTAGFGDAGSSYDVATFTANGQCSLVLIAANEKWMLFGAPQAGTVTNMAITIA